MTSIPAEYRPYYRRQRRVHLWELRRAAFGVLAPVAYARRRRAEYNATVREITCGCGSKIMASRDAGPFHCPCGAVHII